VPGADPTAPAPRAGSNAEDPATTAVTEPPEPAPRATGAARLWVSVALATALLVLLIIFIAENSKQVTVSFLGVHGHISLALALLIAAVVGAAVTLLAGTARILQLRREVRRHKRARRGGGHRQAPR
jgi:uncharacterized integral membrane protein